MRLKEEGESDKPVFSDERFRAFPRPITTISTKIREFLKCIYCASWITGDIANDCSRDGHKAEDDSDKKK